MPPVSSRYNPGTSSGLIELTPEEEEALLASGTYEEGAPPQPEYVATDTNAGSPPPPPPDPAAAPGPPPQPGYAATDAGGGYGGAVEPEPGPPPQPEYAATDAGYGATTPAAPIPGITPGATPARDAYYQRQIVSESGITRPIGGASPQQGGVRVVEPLTATQAPAFSGSVGPLPGVTPGATPARSRFYDDQRQYSPTISQPIGGASGGPRRLFPEGPPRYEGVRARGRQAAAPSGETRTVGDSQYQGVRGEIARPRNEGDYLGPPPQPGYAATDAGGGSGQPEETRISQLLSGRGPGPTVARLGPIAMGLDQNPLYPVPPDSETYVPVDYSHPEYFFTPPRGGGVARATRKPPSLEDRYLDGDQQAQTIGSQGFGRNPREAVNRWRRSELRKSREEQAADVRQEDQAFEGVLDAAGNIVGEGKRRVEEERERSRTQQLIKEESRNLGDLQSTIEMMTEDGSLSPGRRVRFLEQNTINMPVMPGEDITTRAVPVLGLQRRDLPLRQFDFPQGYYPSEPYFDPASATMSTEDGIYIDDSYGAGNERYGKQNFDGSWTDITDSVLGRSDRPSVLGGRPLPQKRPTAGQVFQPAVGTYDPVNPQNGASIALAGKIYTVDGRGTGTNFIRDDLGNPVFEYNDRGEIRVAGRPDSTPFGVNLNDVLAPAQSRSPAEPDPVRPIAQNTSPAQGDPNRPRISKDLDPMQGPQLTMPPEGFSKKASGETPVMTSSTSSAVGVGVVDAAVAAAEDAVSRVLEEYEALPTLAETQGSAKPDTVPDPAPAPALPANDGSAASRVARDFLAENGIVITGAVPGYRQTVGDAGPADTRNGVERLRDKALATIGMGNEEIGAPPSVVDPDEKRARLSQGRTLGPPPPGMPDMGSMVIGRDPNAAVRAEDEEDVEGAETASEPPALPDTSTRPAVNPTLVQRGSKNADMARSRGSRADSPGPNLRVPPDDWQGPSSMPEAPPEVKDPVPVPASEAKPAIASGDGAATGETGSGGSKKTKTSSGGDGAETSSGAGSSRRSGGSSGGGGRSSGGSSSGRTRTFRSSDGRTWSYDEGFDTWTRDDGKMVLGMRSRRMGRKGRRGRKGMGMGMPMPSPMGRSVFANPIFDQYRAMAGDWMPQVYSDGMVGGMPVSSPDLATVPEAPAKKRAGRRDKE